MHELNLDELAENNRVISRCVLVQPLDRDKQPIRKPQGNVYGSGFIVKGIWDNVFNAAASKGSGKTHLYGCWHLITGHDPRNNNTPNNWLQPKYIKIIGTQVSDQNSVNDLAEFIIPLYNSEDKPLWEQEKASIPHEDFNNIGILVPKRTDAFRIEIQLPFQYVEKWAVTPDYVSEGFFSLGEEVYVAGFPYGFSALGSSTPIPIFLRRSVAASFSENYTVSLLDSECAPVMSGGPVFRKIGIKWFLAGMYFGSIHANPDGQNMPLGTILNLTMIRQSIGSVIKTFG